MSETVAPPTLPLSPTRGEIPRKGEAQDSDLGDHDLTLAQGPERTTKRSRRDGAAHEVGAIADAKVREALWTLISASRKSRSEIDRLLEARRGTTAEILEGKLGLKFGVLIRLLTALEIEPAAFFASLFGPPQAKPLTKPLRVEIAERITAGATSTALDLGARHAKAGTAEAPDTTERGESNDRDRATIRIDIDTAGLRALVEHKVTDAIQEVLAQIARDRDLKNATRFDASAPPTAGDSRDPNDPDSHL